MYKLFSYNYIYIITVQNGAAAFKLWVNPCVSIFQDTMHHNRSTNKTSYINKKKGWPVLSKTTHISDRKMIHECFLIWSFSLNNWIAALQQIVQQSLLMKSVQIILLYMQCFYFYCKNSMYVMCLKCILYVTLLYFIQKRWRQQTN